jgi:glycine oxidase
MPKKILIVGQGIAGSVLALTLHNAGVEMYIADQLQLKSASSIAAGVINPVTGKRYVKSWGFDTFYPFAKDFYQKISQAAQQPIWFDYPIVRLLGSALEQNDWNLRVGRPDYEGFTDVAMHAGEWQGLAHPNYGFGVIHQSARVDFSAVCSYVQRFFSSHNRFLDKHITLENISTYLPDFEHIIFCEGYYGAQNELFTGIPWLSAKGDRLLIRLHTDRVIHSMLKKQIMLVPYGAGVYWAGANYYWDFEDTDPSQTGLDFIQEELATMLHVGYDLVDHSAAVRPVAKDRRPIIGWSKDNPKIGIFNGMGSKGALLTPYWAAHFAQHILDGISINKEVDIERFG